jgi:hypothetical protein
MNMVIKEPNSGKNAAFCADFSGSAQIAADARRALAGLGILGKAAINAGQKGPRSSWFSSQLATAGTPRARATLPAAALP